MRRSSMGGSSGGSNYWGYNSSVNAIYFGTDALAEGQDSIAVGKEASVTGAGTYGVALGAYCTVSAAAGVALGENCTASAQNAVAIGFQCVASGTYAKAFGHYANATAPYAIAEGVNVTANRNGQHAFNSGASALAQTKSTIGLTGTGTAAAVNLAIQGGGALNMGTNEVWACLVLVTGFKSDKTASCTVSKIVHLRSNATTATLVGSSSLHDDSATPGWTITMSCPGGLEFRIACDPAADTVHFDATVIWLSRYVA